MLRRGQRAAARRARWCRPTQLLGLEINAYARELAQVVIWIGYLQWMIRQRLARQRPTRSSKPLETIRLQDALLDLQRPRPPEGSGVARGRFHHRQPAVPGRQAIRAELGDDYVDDLFARLRRARSARVPIFVCYFFEKARAQIEARRCQTGRVAGDKFDPRRRESRGARANQGNRRHLPRMV